MNNSKRQKRERREFLKRVMLTLVVLAVFHGLFLGVICVKMGDAPTARHEEEEGFRLWCMSSEDSHLTAVARDFLGMLDMMLSEDTLISQGDIGDPLANLTPGRTLAERENAKLAGGIRLGWPAVTAELDGALPALLDAFELDLSRPIRSANSGAMSLAYDLNRSSLWQPLGLGGAQAAENWKAGGLAERIWHESGRVWASKYEDSAWHVVDASALESRIEKISLDAPADASAMLSERGGRMIYVEVVMGVLHGARAHLRQGSGNRALDDAVMAWALERHAWLGHHRTDAEQTGVEREVDYLIEIRH